jgi:HEAT repeats
VKGRSLTILIMALAVMVLLGLLGPQFRREPSYQSKPSSYWATLVIREEGDHREDSRAFVAMGPRSVPYLLKMIDPPELFVHQWYRDLSPKLPQWMRARLPQPQPKVRIDFARCIRVANTLTPIGPPVVPPFILALADRNAKVRQTAALALHILGTQARTAVPALSKALSDRDPAVRLLAARALGEMGAESRPAIPQLIRVIRDEPKAAEGAASARNFAVYALGQIGSSDGVPALSMLLEDTDSHTRIIAAFALWRIEHQSEKTKLFLRNELATATGEECDLIRSVLTAIDAAEKPPVQPN